MRLRNAMFVLLSCLTVCFVVDRLVKWLALTVLPGGGIFFIPGVTGLILERNQGIAYSIPMPPAMLVAVVSLIFVVLVACIIREYRGKNIAAVSALAMIVFGAFSNLLDRVRYGYVVDAIVLTSWPVFNLADVMILAGAVWLLVQFVHRKNMP